MSKEIIRNAIISAINMTDYLMDLEADNPKVKAFRTMTKESLGGAWVAELTFRFGAPDSEVALTLIDAAGNRTSAGNLIITANNAAVYTNSDHVQ